MELMAIFVPFRFVSPFYKWNVSGQSDMKLPWVGTSRMELPVIPYGVLARLIFTVIYGNVDFQCDLNTS